MSSMSLSDWLKLCITDQAQEIENVVYDLYRVLDLEYWEDEQLNRIGAAVNCERLGLNDENYRIKIKAFAAVQNSSGKPDEILTALKIVTGATEVHITFLPNATIGLTTDGILGSYVVDNLRTFIESALGAGIALDYITNTGDANSFIFSDVADTVTDGKGFDDVTGTGGGGQFNFIIA